MKQKIGILVGFIIFGALVAISLIHDSSTEAQSPESAVKQTVIAYLDAVNKGDVDAMVKYTDDLRYPDKATQTEGYKGLKEDITDVSIASVTPMSSTSYKVDISAKIRGNQEQFSFPVVSKYGTWLIVIGQPAQQQQQQ